MAGKRPEKMSDSELMRHLQQLEKQRLTLDKQKLRTLDRIVDLLNEAKRRGLKGAALKTAEKAAAASK